MHQKCFHSWGPSKGTNAEPDLCEDHIKDRHDDEDDENLILVINPVGVATENKMIISLTTVVSITTCA